MRYSFAYLGYTSPDTSQTVFWFRASISVNVLFLLSAYRFYILYFLNQKGKNIFLERIISSLTMFFATAIFFTDWVIKDLSIKSGEEIKVTFGGLNIFLDVFIVYISSAIIYYFVKRYLSFSKLEKSQAFYFLMGVSIFALANIIFAIIFPIFFGTVKYSSLADYSTILFFIFTAYAIIKKGLFDVKIIFTTLLVALITVLLLVDAFLLTSDVYLKLFKTVIIFIFVYFGYFLIKSITQEIKQKEQLAKLSNKLQDLNLHLQDKVDEQTKEIKVAYEVEKTARLKLEDLNKVKDEFIATAAHQLRTPLSAIRWALKSFLEEVTPGSVFKKEQKDLLEKTYQTNTNLINIVGDLLDTSSVENQNFAYDLQEQDISLLLKEVVSASIFQLKDKKIKINYHEPEDYKIFLKFDQDKLSMAFQNIVSNAIDYTPDGGSIDVTLKKEENQVIIEIKDTGIGIPEEAQAHIFEKFYRGDNAKKTETDRSGLGLYITKTIIEKHGGTVTIESKEGEGTKVVVGFILL